MNPKSPNLPSLGLLIIASVFFVKRWSRPWLAMADGAALVQVITWLSFFDAKSRTEAAGQQGVVALQNAMSENAQVGLYFALAHLVVWAVILSAFVVVARGSAR